MFFRYRSSHSTRTVHKSRTYAYIHTHVRERDENGGEDHECDSVATIDRL